MASITTWTRLEPQSRRATMQQGLQARVHDPLWLLARQWQLGEFVAEDAGTPVSATLRGEAARLTRYHAGPLNGDAAAGQPYDGRTPLEALVEREALTPPASAAHPGRAAEAGLHFLRVLAVHELERYRDAYLAHYGLQTGDDDARDPDGRRFLGVMAGRVIDGARLYADLAPTLRPPSGSPKLPETPAIAAADRERLMTAAGQWLDWYVQRYREPDADGAAWVAERMEYAFAVAAPTSQGETVLAASEYHGGHLDWYHFDQQAGARLDAGPADAPSAPFVRTVIPGPVSYRGMPEARWWTFEDAAVNLSSLEAGPEDLGRMLLLQYALTYSDDWFLMPVELPVGTLLEAHALVVTDAFGIRTRIQPFDAVDGPGGAWRMFTHSTLGDAPRTSGNRLFLPPVLAGSLNGRPVEEVHLLRDELANMAWAVEHLVENARGTAYNRHEQDLAGRPDPAALRGPVPDDAELVYRLMTDVPEHWIPLIPTPEPGTTAMRLRRGTMLQHRGEALREVPPEGRLLEPGRDLRLFDEEVPRDGAHVTRAYQYARWTDGTAHLWMGRRKRPGRGEGWSGLRFDLVEDALTAGP